MATTTLVDQVRLEAVPAVNRRAPRATRRAPRLTRRRAREVPVGPPGRAVGSGTAVFCECECGRACAFRHFFGVSVRLGLASLELSHAVTGEIDSVGIVDDAIEDGVGNCRVADDLVPTLDW